MRKSLFLLKENKQTLTQERNPRPKGETLLLPLCKYWQHTALGSTDTTRGTFLLCHTAVSFAKWSERLILLWFRCPNTNSYVAKASTSWLLEYVVVLLYLSLLSVSKVMTLAMSCARISAVTDHSLVSFSELIRELHLGLLLSSRDL